MKKNTVRAGFAGALAVVGAFCLFVGAEARAEAILQVFNQSHNEIAARLPEIAEAGYTALWVPPPTKANGGMSVGYDLNDPFDIGNSDLRGTWSTRYGVEADLHNLIELCHRFGMRVYFDNVMNHRSYDIPGYNESTPTDVYPGMCPEDFHLRTTSDGFYRKWDNVRSWDDEWQVMFLGLSDLLDIAHETPNQNFGANEGDWHDKPSFVRHPNNPEYYDRKPNGDWVGFGPDNGLTKDDLANNPDFYKEDVGGYLCRAVRWLVDRTKVDGLRLDAVKHVPYYFFGAQGDDASSDGYVGQVQWQFNMSRGFHDWENHRDTVFNSDAARNDAMLFGEHLGSPPPQGPYVGAGMRLVDDRLRNELNWRFSANQLEGFDNDGAGSDLGSACGVMHAQSHDNDYVDRKPLHHAYYFMHKGLGLVYSDGNNHAATLTGSGGAFPRWAQTDFLGQWHQRQIPTLLHAHENFARYDQLGKWSQGNFIAWQRGGEGSYATMLFQLNSLWDGWDYAHTSGDFPSDAYLYDYASDMYMPHNDVEGWPECPYAWGGEIASTVKLPPNSYAIWNWKNPDPSGLYPTPYPECFETTDDRIIAPDSRVITLMEDGKVVEPVWVTRKDGVDGDPDFNPYGVADTNNTDYAYRIAIPRVTKGTDVTLAVKADGSAESMRLRLDGGMDFGNGIEGARADGDAWGTPDLRDSPPGAADDFWLGFEDTSKWFTRRIWSEKFASVNTEYCKIGTQGATSYESSGATAKAYESETVYDGPRIEEPAFVYHDPTAETETVPVETGAAVTTTNTYTALASVNGQDSADGFGDWVVQCNDNGGAADWFLHDKVGETGLTGFTGNQAWGLWAKPYVEDNNPNAQVIRAISHASGLKSISVDVGMLWDSSKDDSYKGIEFMDAGGSPIFGVQMQNTQEITYYGVGGASGTWSEGYGEAVFKVTLTRKDGGYTVTGTTRDGSPRAVIELTTGADIATFKAYMNGVPSFYNEETGKWEEDFRQLYFDNLSYTAVVKSAPTGDRQVPQFTREGTSATVWVKTSHEQGARTFLYYTVDGDHWPEGGGGVPANPYTKAVEGSWKCDSEGGSWWRFDLSGIPAGATLRYKVSAFREMGYGGNDWGTVWPGDGHAVWVKKAMMSLWTINGLDFTKQSFHKHNDYTSWTTGFKDGYHLATARVFLNRNDGAPVANTFRQTFYLDLHTPEGKFMYPSEDSPTFGEAEYGMVFKTDNTVDEVWVHIADSDDSNDGVGNGITTNGVVEWAKATQISPWTKEDAQDTQLTKIWRWTYSRIPDSGTATIRVRLREVSSAPVEEWSKEDPAADDLDALHVTELLKTANTRGPAETFYIEWPDQDGTMVEAGWEVRVNFTQRMVSGLDDEQAATKFRVYVNVTSNGSTERGGQVENSDINLRHHWHNWEGSGDGLNQVTFNMPNVYNGIDGWRYALTVEFENGSYSKTATRMITHKGPLLPTCIITTPPETDSDGVKYVITMEDSTEAAKPENRALRETPIVVLTDAEATKVELAFLSPTNYSASITATPAGAKDNDRLRFVGVEGTGTSRSWNFAWQVANAGSYRVQAKVTVDNSSGRYSAPTNAALRTATIRFRQLVHVTDPNDADWDDDGADNKREQENLGMPTGESEYWTQDAIFDYWSTGKSDPDCPDSDGDGLPDALELGYRKAADGTDASTDTNGDGWPNFIWDRDPPFYNSCESLYGKVPGVTSATEGGDRLALVKGSTTDPRNPDSDGDGIPDGIEDANHNGWTDGDGAALPGDWDPYWDRAWPDGKVGAKEIWEETSPRIQDSDADGLSDGYGEDVNYNGRTDIALRYENGAIVDLSRADCAALGILVDNNSTANTASTLADKPVTTRAIDYAKLFEAYNVSESGKSGTRQTNGWPRLVIAETDPLCTDTDHDGLPDGWETSYQLDPLNNGVYDFRTGQFVDDPTHGPLGNPDGDTYIQGQLKVPYDNAAEYLGGTNPRSNDNAGGSSASGSVAVGSGDPIGEINGTTYYTEATQWTLDDLVALDDYNQGGNSSDIYRFGDGYDSSRDMVAFYFRDGGSSAAGGDDRLYFRVDFDDLQAFAEDGRLNVYVAMNFGNYGNGIEWLPDDVNCESAMRWNAVAGVYDSQNGCVYVKRGGEDAYDIKNDRFLGAWFNAEIDTVVWAIDRTALVEAGWNGLSDNLMFQVYTTRDFTNDDGGSGDKGGLNDFADTIGDDWLCSDYWNDYNYIAQHGIYSTCVSRTGNDHAWNNRGQHAKLAMVAHGNQAIEPGNAIQAIVDNGAGAGYGRPIQIHNIYTNCPLNLHITPTLAIALQWAEAGTEKTWYSGPALNAAIKKGVASGALSLLGSTYSDHIPLYFSDDFNAANVERATAVLDEIYGDGSNVVSSRVLWSPERVVDADWLLRMGNLGFQATIVDQTPHLLDWYGRKAALGNEAYKIQQYWIQSSSGQWKSSEAFALSSAASGFRYVNTDGGLASDLRRLFLRRARTGDAAISSIFYMWEDFASSDNANAYDRSLRWIANHPWIQVVTLDAALDDPVLSGNHADHNLAATNGMAMQDWVHHACNGSYDNWYYGSDRHESLAAKKFEVREGEPIPTAYGSPTNGILHDAWAAVTRIRNPQVKALAEATIFASAFETAFHNEANGNLARWSYGEYIYPATEWEGLMSMAWRAQSRTRLAAMYAAVDEWTRSSAGVEALSADLDLDGEPEWILRNNTVMAVFEAEGGLMVGAWYKKGTNVWQMVGNFAAQPETGYETQSAGTDSTRGTAMKDLDVGGSPMTGAKYTVTTGNGTLTFKSGAVTKTVSISGGSSGSSFWVVYDGTGGKLVVRNGLSPDLATLMLGGQARLSETSVAPQNAEEGGALTLTTTSGGSAVSATVRVHHGSFADGATDQPKDSGWNTVNMRNAPQVRQVDVEGNAGGVSYEIEFGTAETQREPPTLAVAPSGTQTFPVGHTSSFRVTATDWQGKALPVKVTDMPVGTAWSGTPAWDASTGVFSWKMGAPSDGSRIQDIHFQASFSATDGSATVATNVTIVVPWDSVGNEMGDDWEYFARRKSGEAYDGDKDGDADGDGFVNYSEWIAGTDPSESSDYIGWFEQTVQGTNVLLKFKSVPDATYWIEETESLLATNWLEVGSIASQGRETVWVGPRHAAGSYMYRIRIPSVRH